MKPILYLGDDDASRAAAYLCGVLTWAGIPFERVSSGVSPAVDFDPTRYSAMIVSDYASEFWRAGQMEQVLQAVHRGMGFAMFGGWESFHGLKSTGEYNRTPLSQLLPVLILDSDDRRNFAQPCLVVRTVDPQTKRPVEHEMLAGLPWETNPPGIGGVCLFTPKPGTRTLLDAVPLRVSVHPELWECSDVSNSRSSPDEMATAMGGRSERCPTDASELERISTWKRPTTGWRFDLCDPIPLLVTGSYGLGRTVAFASDVAPHWVGGMVDWGTPRRVTQTLCAGAFAELSTDGFIEVGADYATFFRQLTQWLAAEPFDMKPEPSDMEPEPSDMEPEPSDMEPEPFDVEPSDENDYGRRFRSR